MKKLRVAMAGIEVGAGVALLCCPSATVALLLGSGLDTPAALTLGRLAGVALLALGVACWLVQYDAQSCAARGLISAMVLYNFGAVVILRYCRHLVASGRRGLVAGGCAPRGNDRVVRCESAEQANTDRRQNKWKQKGTKTMRPARLITFTTLAALALTLGAGCATAQTAQPAARPADSGFSFAVYGDSRSMMYLPYKSDQEAEARELMADMFELVLPEKVAAEVVKKDVKLIYDPATHELVEMVMPFMTHSEVTYLTIDKGWVTEASVEDVKLMPGVRHTMFRLQGGDWVAREMVKDVQSGRAKFIVSTGDLVWWGKQGDKPSDSPYWKLVNEDVMKKLPAPDDQMQAAGLTGRVFPAVGNHEVWGDPDVEGLLSVFPYLKKLGVSDKQLIYKFDFNGAHFIFLWTGKYDYREPTAWGATRPSFEEQMKQLQLWLDEAKTAGTRKIFVAFHNPAFARSGMGAIPEAQNPHKILASYAKDLDIVVFNGHVHTTELYKVDGVMYLLLGGGGAEQDPILPGRTHIKVPADYPPDLYWKGESPKEDYNYVLVDVKPGQKTKFTLNRFRPWSAEPFATVELFGSPK